MADTKSNVVEAEGDFRENGEAGLTEKLFSCAIQVPIVA